MNNLVLMSIRTKYVNEIFSGKKVYEYRRKSIGENNLNKTIYIYSSGIDKAIVGYIIVGITIGQIKSDWKLFIVSGIQLLLCYFNIDWLYKGEEEYAYIAKRNLIIKAASLICIFVFVFGSRFFNIEYRNGLYGYIF